MKSSEILDRTEFLQSFLPHKYISFFLPSLLLACFSFRTFREGSSFRREHGHTPPIPPLSTRRGGGDGVWCVSVLLLRRASAPRRGRHDRRCSQCFCPSKLEAIHVFEFVRSDRTVGLTAAKQRTLGSRGEFISSSAPRSPTHCLSFCRSDVQRLVAYAGIFSEEGGLEFFFVPRSPTTNLPGQPLIGISKQGRWVDRPQELSIMYLTRKEFISSEQIESMNRIEEKNSF